MDKFPRLASLSSGTVDTDKDLGKDLVEGTTFGGPGTDLAGIGGPGAGPRVEGPGAGPLKEGGPGNGVLVTEGRYEGADSWPSLSLIDFLGTLAGTFLLSSKLSLRFVGKRSNTFSCSDPI